MRTRNTTTPESAAARPAETPPAVRLRTLQMHYPTSKGHIHAVGPLDLDIADREFVAVVGPSGCGKTTVLRILAGLVMPSSGEAYYYGDRLTGPRRGCGVVFQGYSLLPWKTVLDNVLLPLRMHRRMPPGTRDRALELLEAVGLSDFVTRYPFELSGGMQQRTALVRALIHRPSLLLLDEPFGALDALTRDRLNLLLQDIWLKERTTVFLITHSVNEALFLADRVVVMSARPGRIVSVHDVPGDRPRQLDMLARPEIAELGREIRSLLDV
ncbi:ABC transporter ATP-binding protein [Actinophytocola sp.]|uniref:ABC transporter ATP-binding protein n=1 Tax=Actinophytocola sp. TaxID=1872138 RepID=UPI003D6A6610